MLKRIVFITLMVSLVLPICLAALPAAQDFPAVLSMRDRAK